MLSLEVTYPYMVIVDLQFMKCIFTYMYTCIGSINVCIQAKQPTRVYIQYICAHTCIQNRHQYTHVSTLKASAMSTNGRLINELRSEGRQ